MERALVINDIGRVKRLKEFDRLYYGAQFCQHLIPALEELKIVSDIIQKKKKALTFLTPYVTGGGIEKLEPLLNHLNRQNDNSEVVFNDWGVFKLIKEKYSNIRAVLGRLLTKQRRDPRAYDILFNKQKIHQFINKKNKTRLIISPKSVPPSLYEHFKASVVNVPIFQKFLLANNIKRLEVDNLIWDMKIEVDKNIAVSAYFPYGYITTTRLCGLLNLTYSACRKRCQKEYFSFKMPSSPVPFYMRGNTIFYKSKIPKESCLKKLNIDRIIYECP